jgi:hypothetical protein
MIVKIEHSRDGEIKIIKVPIAESKLKATLYEDDFDDLMRLGISPKWKLYHDQIVVRNNGRYVGVGRLIRHAGPNQRVVCKDDDATNLRRDNLVLAPGPSRYDARSCIARPFKNKTIIEHISA